MNQATRRIWLCADDYGIAPGVNAAIRDLAAQGRLNATSAMVLAPSLDQAAVDALRALNTEGVRVRIGLHFTLTAPFAPLSENYRPLREARFLSLAATLLHALARRLERAALAREAEAQMLRFIALFGQPPDFVDGHQHVHLFPQVRDAVIAATLKHAPAAWLRQCTARGGLSLSDPKGMLIDRLSRRFRRDAEARGIAVNPAFAGTYTYVPDADFAVQFPGFLEGLPDGGLVMCHPGQVDAELERLDPLTSLREREYAYLASENLVRDLAHAGVALR
jgi:chitin disaccharide deacetylase